MICPQHFQDRVTRAGGNNRYGGPNFRIAWSRTETFRAGGVWPHDHFAGYREVYAANCSPVPPKQGYWMLMEWKAPEDFGGEAVYRFLHRDDETGLCLTGPYPSRGRYEKAVPLIDTAFDNGKMILYPWPLNSRIVDRIIPLIKDAKTHSVRRRREFAAAEKAQVEKKLERNIEAVMKESKRPLLLPSQIDDRIRLLERQWSEWMKRPKFKQTGFQQA